MERTGTSLSVLVAAFLLAAVALALAFSFIGPDRVEQQSIDLFRGEQRAIAQQGAQRISENLRHVQVRFETDVEQTTEALRRPSSRSELRRTLETLHHASDRQLGLTLHLFEPDGRLLASYPPESIDRESQPEPLRPTSDSPPFLFCTACLDSEAAIAFTHRFAGPRTLAANIDLEKFIGAIFQDVTRETSSHAALVSPEGRLLYQTGRAPGSAEQDSFVIATSPVPGTNWHVRVAAPRAAVAPEIGDTVTMLLVVNYAIIGILIIGLGLFGYLEWSAYSERLERLRQMAQQHKLATLGMMAASTSHEINNALSAAQLQIELARRKAAAPLHEHLDAVASSVDRLGSLAENLSNYASPGPDESRDFPLREVLDETLEIVRPKLAPETRLEVAIDTNPLVHGASAALTQVFVNLVLNAAEAVEDHPQGRIAIQTARQDETAIVTVTDNGEGIPPEILDEIFDPFVTSKRDRGGTGIGLWLCARILDQHGGEIEAENLPDAGARLTVSLPVAERDAEPDQTGGDEQ